MAMTTVVVVDGERWDSIAVRAYGDAMLMQTIIRANPDVPMWDRLEGGMVLAVPVIDGRPASVNGSLLPPWKK